VPVTTPTVFALTSTIQRQKSSITAPLCQTKRESPTVRTSPCVAVRRGCHNRPRITKTMDDRPDIRYASNSGVNVAYARWGKGETVIVYTPPWISNVELEWEIEEYARMFRHGGAHHEVIGIDKRGVGLSDRTNVAPTLEERVADTLAVMDAEGLSSAVLGGVSEGGAISVALAARHPERVQKLLLVGATLPGVSPSELRRHVQDGDPTHLRPR